MIPQKGLSIFPHPNNALRGSLIVKSNLFRRGFLSLVMTQFFGAMNDNILKGVLVFMVINGVWAGMLGTGGQGIVGICFTIPFILLSGYAGQVADRYSKTSVTQWVKIAEVPIALLAAVGFYIQNLWLTLFALIALTCQSAFFGPAKYGMIPELVDDSDLSRANGSINMMTNVAVIVGTLIAGLVSDAYFPLSEAVGPATAVVANGELWLPGVSLVVVAIAGLIAAMFMVRLPAGKKVLKFDLNPFTTYLVTIREMRQTRLFMVMMAWGYFYLLAGIALFILPEYTTVMGISRAGASVLMGVLGIAIGLGCAAAGLVSGHQIKPRLIPFGALGLIIFFFLLAIVEPLKLGPKAELWEIASTNVSLFIFCAGFSSGFYIIPLQALLQSLSPSAERGRYLGTANGVSFAFLTIAAAFYFVCAPIFVGREHKMFYVCSGLMAVGAVYFLWAFRGSGMLIGNGASTESPLTTADLAESRGDETLSDDTDATECTIEYPETTEDQDS